MPPRWKALRTQLRRRWNDLYDGQRNFLKLLALVAALAVTLPLAYVAARPAINSWRHKHALQQADEFERAEDYRNMLLALHRATEIKPGDVETWRRVAQQLDALGMSDALVARENVVNLAPDDPAARVALAAAALRFEAPDVARNALRELARVPSQREEFLRLSAELARDAGDLPRYEEHLTALAELSPADLEVRYNLALLKFYSVDAARAQAGREELRALVREPRWRVRVALDLLRDAANRRDAALAGETVRWLGANLRDAPANTSAPTTEPWTALREALCSAAESGGAADVARVSRWLGTVRRGEEALAWLDGLPAETREHPAVRDIAAEICARSGAFDRLRQGLADGAWGSLLTQPIFAAIEARQEQLRGQEARSLARWQDAITAAENSPATLRALSRLAQLWQIPAATENALRTTLRVRPKSTWAYRELRDFYFQRRDTARLFAHYENWSQAQPASALVLAGWVRTGAALGRVNAAMEERTAAAVAVDSPPAQALIARAIVLRARGKSADALSLLETLSPAYHSRDDVAYLLAVLYRDRGEAEGASAWARRVKAENLLNEEAIALKPLR